MSRAKRIPVAGPWITDLEVQYVQDAALNAWYEKANFYNERFEKTFAEYIGSRYAVSLPSCTSAIHLSLLAAGVGPGDEVIVPDMTWIASSAPISYVGATPVFADVDEHTWCLGLESVRNRLSAKTKAIISVDLYGSMPDYPALEELAESEGIFLVEDAAEAFGSQLNGKRAGAYGDTGVFSFHGSKTLTTGEGGMLVTDDQAIYDRVLFLRDHGRVPGDTSFQNVEVAYKYKMSALQAAFGLAQAERADELVARKREIFDWYSEDLTGVDELMLNNEIEGGLNSYWMVSALAKDEVPLTKFELIEEMAAFGVDCRPVFSPLSGLKAYGDIAQKRNYRELNPVAYQLSDKGINLPSGFNLEREDVSYVCENLIRIIRAQAV